MSALWLHADMVTECERYVANDIKLGITGWAMINGRDELESHLKAKLDGEYVEKIGFVMDIKCFFGTIKSVFKSNGVVEGAPVR